jgi:transcriptional regulator with XRE-family HTH domain
VARVSGKADDEGQLAKLGDAIRARRVAVGITQEALAQAADIERAHMSKIERGRRNVTMLNMLRIAAALGCPAAEILAAAGL